MFGLNIRLTCSLFRYFLNLGEIVFILCYCLPSSQCKIKCEKKVSLGKSGFLGAVQKVTRKKNNIYIRKNERDKLFK